ncbi:MULTISPECIES: alpha/beta fold hydrolase [Dyella]|uniref:Alpha/beta hydrolase n=2 Tax=Dyella TaxID=231454 RepID=A0A4R0YXC4_9GAMM|nr:MULTISPECIES: alpha/beta fold hydrolase [Dyella]TBR40408.1 alpha/beta hydrolase [Dyella terrae]TCI12009.1 alpha/beta hydrolase [Dyella soli]
MTILVVLPGLDGTATLHSDFSNAVRTAFESVAVISYPSNQVLDYIALERLVRSELPPTAQFVLLGESFSGPIALSIAANPPSNLLGVVLSTTFAESPVPLFAPFAPLLRLAPLRALPLPLVSWWLLGRWATPQLEAALQSALLTVLPEVLRSRARTAMRANALAVCRLVDLPVLYLRGTNDRLLNRRASRKIAEAIEHCIIKDVAGPHLLLQAAPAACAKAVSEFALGLGC